MAKILFLLFLSINLFADKNLLLKKNVQSFINMMVNDYHFDRVYIEEILKDSVKKEKILQRYIGKFKSGSTDATWSKYKKHALNNYTIKLAKKFKKKYLKVLKRAQKIYGVNLNYIVAFLAIESKFGKYTGNTRVIDSLTTLAFYKNRMQDFFYNELKELFLLSRERGLDINYLYGSFAGAMGVVQQIPSVQRKYGVDFNNDGLKDAWNIEDSIGTIANFLKKNGWQDGEIVAVKSNFKGKNFDKLYCSYKSKYPLSKLEKIGIKPLSRFPYKWAYLLKLRYKDHQEIWLGGKNFGVITSYNHSTNYGMAIFFLANKI